MESTAQHSIEELRQARLLLEHAYGRLHMFTFDMGDRDAQAIINWAIFDLTNEIYTMMRAAAVKAVRS